MQDIAPWIKKNSGQELDVVSQFSGHSSALWSGELDSRPSETSLVTTVSAFHQPPSRSCGHGMPTSDESRSMWYTDTPTIKDSLKALLHSTAPNSSTEAMQHPASDTPVKRPIPGVRNIPSVLPLLSQLSRPSTSTSCTSTSSSSFKPEFSQSLDQPTTTSFHPPQQSPFGLDNKEKLPSDQPRNVSMSPNNTPNGSESIRRPLPKPPRESSALRRTQSSTPSTATSARTFRSLPPTPLLEVSEPEEISDNSHIHSRSPPMKKASPEFTRWVHELTDPQRVLSPTPSPGTVVFDLPPPSYTSIYFAQDDKPNCVATPTTTTAPST